ncbi:MAG TPA: hypothetical protein DCZ94_04280 [Lentisphaeria bacterium]|nr:MAG: hypothetical protein A2X48_05500 [Lentisphaerae bacterium GWF2_49_21]HBC86154.1 hypothetical protein [Lentisphaeria bacterium]
MNAIRDIVEVKSNHIVYDLPNGFSSGKVELIIMPVENNKILHSDKRRNKPRIRGSLRKYSNPSLMQLEKKAWSLAAQVKHAHS